MDSHGTPPTQTYREPAAEPPSSSPDSEHGRFLPGTMLAGRYRIVALLGSGGMGEVYRADDLKLGQAVALKFLPKRLADDADRLSYFHNEVRLARGVSHPNVCRVYDIGEIDGEHFISMEYVDGEDLASLLRRIGRLPPDKGVSIAQQLCAGLAAAHDRGVLHRDLKPANIMLDGRGRARITDFGLARLTDELKESESRAGTPAYMAPEQLERGETTIQSDIYSLGLVLYELFTGKRAFRAGSRAELARLHADSTPPSPSSLVSDLDPAVERVILHCLESQPADRPESALAVAAKLPGGDPLAAALAAGETPSPELVANAKEEGSLPPGVGVTFLLLTLVAMVIWVAHKANLTVSPEESVSDLSTHATDMLGELGYDDLSKQHSVQGLMRYDAYLAYIGESGPPDWSVLEEQDGPPQYVFWKRWSKEGFQTGNLHEPWPSHIEPPQSTPGSITVMLDTHGRLVALSIIPVPSLPSPTENHALDVKDIFARAGLHIDELEGPTTEPTWPPNPPPPAHCDRVEKWTGQGPPKSGGPFTIQVGWYHDRLVHFVIYWEWDENGVLNQAAYDTRSLLAQINLFFFSTAAILPVFLILAWRNLRLGRTDQRGALWYASLVLGTYFLRELVAIRLGESGFIDLIHEVFDGRHLGHAVLHGFQAWLAYLAIEPYVRRIWPRSLVGWTRFAKGRRRDPQVGREVLVGVLLGSVTLIAAIVVSRLAWYFDWPHASPLHAYPEALHNIPWLIARIIPSSILINIITLYVWLVIIRQITGSEWAAVGLVTFLKAALLYDDHVYLGGQTVFDPATLIWVLVLSSLIVLAMVRLGLITAIMIQFTAIVMLLIPLSVEFPSDFSTQMFLGLMTLVGLALFGFFVSLGGEPIVRGPTTNR